MIESTIINNSYISNLNNSQLLAVESTEGPVLVLAGAGTGKTKVLTSRIANIIHKGYAHSSQILSVTFTNKAARDMNHRLSQVVNNVEHLWLGTFHSIAVKILRKHAEHVGLNSKFNIIDADDQLRLVKNICDELNIDVKQSPPKLILSVIQRWKDLGLANEEITSEIATTTTAHIARRIYQIYQERLGISNSVDFGDLLLHNITIFKNNRDILNFYQNKFKYVLVDEYQDTNVIQYLWIRMLAQQHKNIFCVGDDDQSIYGWRGAEITNILRFEQDFMGAKVIRLEQNYRSTNHIIAAAAKIISNNNGRLGKTLWTDCTDGEKIKLVSLWNDKDEAYYIANEIKAAGVNNSTAILVRAGFQTRLLEEAMIAKAIPYKVIGGLRFYDRLEIKDIIAYIKVSLFHNDDLAFERIINTPKRSIGKATIDLLRSHANANGCSLFTAVEEAIRLNILKGKTKAALIELTDLIKKWGALFESSPHFTVVEQVVTESGYLDMWKNEPTIEAATRVENIKELFKSLQDFNDITEFMEYISLVAERENKDETNSTQIMTLHAAKGLEFDTVFLAGWEEGLFPHQRALEEEGITGLEEERRLAYVGITRAKKRLYILHALSRRMYNQWQNTMASRFVNELPEDNIIKIQPNPYLQYPSSPTITVNLKTRQKVFHTKFGYGEVILANGENLEILFEDQSLRKIKKDFVEFIT